MLFDQKEAAGWVEEEGRGGEMPKIHTPNCTFGAQNNLLITSLAARQVFIQQWFTGSLSDTLFGVAWLSISLIIVTRALK